MCREVKPMEVLSLLKVLKALMVLLVKKEVCEDVLCVCRCNRDRNRNRNASPPGSEGSDVRFPRSRRVLLVLTILVVCDCACCRGFVLCCVHEKRKAVPPEVAGSQVRCLFCSFRPLRAYECDCVCDREWVEVLVIAAL